MTSTEPAAKQIAAGIDGSELRDADGHSHRLSVTDLKPVRPRAGWYCLAVALRDPHGNPSQTPLMMGIVSGGGRGVMPWFECRLYPTVELANGRAFDARAAGLEAAMVNLIGRLDGHVMIEYESLGQSGTHAEPLLHVPP
jgi:hypothetical protein